MREPQFQHPAALVTADWLQANSSEPNLRIFDCTVYLIYDEGSVRPYKIQSGRQDYESGHIPGSGFLDLQQDFSISDSSYRFTLPPADELAASFARFGIGDDTRVVLYSRANIQWATRFWWMLRWLGFDNAAILDGGFDKWAADGRPISQSPSQYPPAQLTPEPRPGLFVGKETVAGAIGDVNICTINALAANLHSGELSRYGRPGHIPGSVNVPVASLLDGDSLEIASPRQVAERFAAVGAAADKQIITYCGGGIAATLDAFLLHQPGYQDIAVYDNSMSEWATDPALPMEVG